MGVSTQSTWGVPSRQFLDNGQVKEPHRSQSDLQGTQAWNHEGEEAAIHEPQGSRPQVPPQPEGSKEEQRCTPRGSSKVDVWSAPLVTRKSGIRNSVLLCDLRLHKTAPWGLSSFIDQWILCQHLDSLTH